MVGRSLLKANEGHLDMEREASRIEAGVSPKLKSQLFHLPRSRGTAASSYA
jgi:hypothetical protein